MDSYKTDPAISCANSDYYLAVQNEEAILDFKNMHSIELKYLQVL